MLGAFETIRGIQTQSFIDSNDNFSLEHSFGLVTDNCVHVSHKHNRHTNLQINPMPCNVAGNNGMQKSQKKIIELASLT